MWFLYITSSFPFEWYLCKSTRCFQGPPSWQQCLPLRSATGRTEKNSLHELREKELFHVFMRVDLLLLLLSHFSRVRLCETPWTAAFQAPPSMEFSRQEYWSGVPLPSLFQSLHDPKCLYSYFILGLMVYMGLKSVLSSCSPGISKCDFIWK